MDRDHSEEEILRNEYKRKMREEMEKEYKKKLEE